MDSSSQPYDILFAPTHGYGSYASGQGAPLYLQLSSDLSDAFAQDAIPPWAATLLEDIGCDAAAQYPCIVPSLEASGDFVMGDSPPNAQEISLFSAAQVPGEDHWSALPSGVCGDAPLLPFDALHQPRAALSHPYPSQPCYDFPAALCPPCASVSPPGSYAMAPNAPKIVPFSLPAETQLDPLEFGLGSHSDLGSWNMPLPSLFDNPYLTPPLSPFPLPSSMFADSVAADNTPAICPDLPVITYSLASPAPTPMSPSISGNVSTSTRAEALSSSPPSEETQRALSKRMKRSASHKRDLRKASFDPPHVPSSPPPPPSQYTGRFKHLDISRYASRTAQAPGTSLPAPIQAGTSFSCPICTRSCRDRSGAQRHIRAHFRGLRAPLVCAGVRIAADDPRACRAPERCWEDDAGQVWFGGCWREMSRRDALRRHARVHPACRQGLPPI